MARDSIVSVRLTADERAALARLAERRKATPSRVLRDLLRDAAFPAHPVGVDTPTITASGPTGIRWFAEVA